ncbi:MAG TPA: hypothetical protein VGH28_26875 [Polyangiaceae bacterium]
MYDESNTIDAAAERERLIARGVIRPIEARHDAPRLVDAEGKPVPVLQLDDRGRREVAVELAWRGERRR